MNTFKFIIGFCFIIAMADMSAQNSVKLLEKIYKKRAVEQLDQFFTYWHHEIPPITEQELATENDTLKNVYGAFTTFYQPIKIDTLGGSEWGNDIYKSVKYLIVQNEIKVYITSDKLYCTNNEKYEFVVNCYKNLHYEDSIKLKERLDYLETIKNDSRGIEHFVHPNCYYKIEQQLIDSLENFRPQINCGAKLPIYLTPAYSNLLNIFLGNSHYEFGDGNIMNPERSMGASKRRKKFLEKVVKIGYGHWGGYWQFLSYPQATSITFDKEMEYAKIDFRMVYEGGEAFLKKENGTWKLISSRLTWIE